MYGERLKELRKQSGMYQEDVADAVGTTSRKIGYYESKDRRPNPDMLIKLADFFNVTVDYILGRSDTPHDSYLNSNIIKNEMVNVKVLHDIKSGRPLFTDEQIKGEISFSKNVLNENFQYFVLEVGDDSLSGNSISKGDLVLIKAQNYIDHDGQLAAVIVDDEISCLRYIAQSEEFLIFRSANPDFKDIVRPSKEVLINGVFSGLFKNYL